MSNYTKTTDFAAKDSLPTGDSGKIIRGAEFETEFDAISTAIATKADTAGPTFTGTATFATTNATTVQIGGVAITSTAAELNTLDGITSTTAELNTLDGFTGTVDDLNYAKDLRASGVTAAEFDILDGLTATAAELNILDGATLSTAELNLLDGVTATTAELNILDGVTADFAEINILDGATVTTAELNLLDGVTATTAELNYVDGVTSAIQTQLDAKAPTASPTLTGTITAAGLIITNRQVATDDASGVNIDGNDVTIRGGASTGTGAGGSVLFQTTPADVAGNLINTFSTVMTLDENGIDVAGAVEFDSLSGTGVVSVTDILDEDDMTSDSATALATQQSIKAYIDTTVAATNELVEDTTPQLGGDLDTNGNDILFADNDKAIFGAGSDLKIYHDGSDSYIDDTGTGRLRLRGAADIILAHPTNGETYAIFSANGANTFYYDDSAKLETTATGIDVTGSVTADGLTVDGDGTLQTSDGAILSIGTTDTSATTGDVIGQVTFANADASPNKANAEIRGMANDAFGRTNIDFRTGNSGTLNTRALISWDGDISFYEDTGTTAKLFWDASAESLGIGTSSPSATLEVDGVTNSTYLIVGGDDSSNGRALTFTSSASAAFNGAVHTIDAPSSQGVIALSTGSTERMRIDSSGRVGIGTNSPSSFSGDGDNLVVGTTSGNNGISIISATDGSGNLYFGDTATTGGGSRRGQLVYDHATDSMRFATAVTEAMRIDSSGNLLVGTTTTTAGNEGMVYFNGSSLRVTRDGDEPLNLDRLTTDGSLIDLKRDGTPFGSIGSNSSLPYFAGTSIGLKISSTQIRPSNSTGNNNDDAVDLGKSDTRFKDLYLSGGAYLGGTGSANKLDDYEEGTWTPTQGSFTTWTSPTFDARYTKVGRMVFINLRQTGGTIGWSSQQQMGGLPFAPSQGASAYATDDGPVSDNGALLIWTASNVYFQKSNASETSLVFSAMYYTSA